MAKITNMNLDPKILDQRLIDQLQSLSINFWDFKHSDTHEFTHGLHSYPAVMICHISRNIIKIMNNYMRIESLFDPFCGSGTVLVEGMLAGIKQIVGNDLNPLARLLSKVKTTPIDHKKLNQYCASLLYKIKCKYDTNRQIYNNIDSYLTNKLKISLIDKKGWGDNAIYYLNRYLHDHNIQIQTINFKNIGYWFKPSVILFLQTIKEEINQIDDQDIKDFAYIAMSETIRLVSNRRNGEFKLFRMPEEKIKNFKPDVLYNFSSILYRNTIKMQETVKIVENRKQNIKIYNNNATHLCDIPNEEFDLVVTSPPYGDSKTTVAYGQYSRLSLQWIYNKILPDKQVLDLDKTFMGGTHCENYTKIESQTFNNALEAIEKQDSNRAKDVYSFYYDLNKSLQEIAQKTKKNCYQFWVVGNRTVKNVLLKTDKIITELAPQYNLKYIFTIDRNIPNKVMPSLNSPTNIIGKTMETMTHEHIVVLRKI